MNKCKNTFKYKFIQLQIEYYTAPLEEVVYKTASNELLSLPTLLIEAEQVRRNTAKHTVQN
jgi:hypothetical protein